MTNLPTSGIIVPLITPFDSADNINFNVAEKLINMHLGCGVRGFYIGGSSGEGLLQSLEERKEFLSFAASVNQRRGLMIAQVGSMSLKDAIALAQIAADCHYDYISSTPPLYFTYTSDDIEQYYVELAEQSPIPLILYNVPATTGRALSLETMERLMDQPNIAGVKYTDTNMFPLQQLIASRPSRLYYNGPDEMLLAGLSLGANGGIGSTYNVLPKLWCRLYQHFVDQDFDQALKLQNQANHYIRTLLKVSPTVIPGIKASLAILSYGVGHPRKPLQAVSAQGKKELEQALTLIN